MKNLFSFLSITLFSLCNGMEWPTLQLSPKIFEKMINTTKTIVDLRKGSSSNLYQTYVRLSKLAPQEVATLAECPRIEEYVMSIDKEISQDDALVLLWNGIKANHDEISFVTFRSGYLRRATEIVAKQSDLKWDWSKPDTISNLLANNANIVMNEKNTQALIALELLIAYAH